MKATLGLLLLLATACTPFRPGQGVTPDFATAWGCDADSVAVEAARLEATLERGHVYVPHVGWTACDVMAHNGAPDRVDRQESADIVAATWWYECADCDHPTAHLVSLQLDRARQAWIVTYVGW